MEEQPDTEILVHIGAPSRAIHDALYRSLAAAYLAFEPTETTHIYSCRGQNGRSQSGTSGSRGANDAESSIMPLDERIQSFRSPQVSFKSVVDNADSPRMHMRPREISDRRLIQQTPISATQTSWQTPPSIVQDSHPLNHAGFSSLTSPTRVLESYLQYFESPSTSPRQASQSSRLIDLHDCTPRCSSRHFSQRNHVPRTQLIPCTPQPKNTAELPFARNQVSESQTSRHSIPQSESLVDNAFNDTIIEESAFLSSPRLATLIRADSEPVAKLRRLGPVANPHALARASSDIGPESSTNRKPGVTVSFLSSHGFTYESLEIRSPEPLTSELFIESQELITRGLEKLGHDVDLPLRFRPSEQRRELRPSERGYWLVDCSSWEPQLKLNAWAFLANYIGTGMAGWGIWCKRDHDFEEIRTYCWGSVVAHIYYVLWLSSHREIVFTGCCWVDADGARVITMSPRSHPQSERNDCI
ncbi:hypothetical protein F5B22DRAFT_404370 [Xylaria bambusicola]|uniref:uncharacterized protein n=1 Tax=Xylaria bambusicola TaxID=326684 RepID=UPI002008540E|nr:uncharacterized protein F5B22DRAFT_404370 [Xylaria bambusicola]KAI0508399.1 hypothetical protein F5B22DRAFT_404370 [Xylaria bambusicola]